MRLPGLGARIVGVALVLGTLASGSAPTGGAAETATRAAYPTVLPDFAHRDDPHSPLYSFAGGQTDRDVLTIYVTFDDAPMPADKGAAWAADRVYGSGITSAAGYYSAVSFGDLTLTPARETQGTPNDGVVVVNAGLLTEWLTFPDESIGNLRLAVSRADPFVDFASYDADGDGGVNPLELTVLVLGVWDGTIAAPVFPGGPCGGTRGLVSVVPFDGVHVGLPVAGVWDRETFMTLTHELGHALWDLEDFYGYGAGRWDVAGPTCSGVFDETKVWNVTAYQRLHLGWDEPTVVTADGYHTISRSDAPGNAFLLYDPDRGPSDYFLVEYRASRPTTVDEDAPDTGLVIWRVDDTKMQVSTPDTEPPLELMRPDGVRLPPACGGGCYQGSDTDAWNPRDPDTPQRTMTRPWRDGTASNLAIRGIADEPSLSNAMDAFFDVRGPGVFVDPYELRGAELTTGTTTEFCMPVMNTDDAGTAARAFTFTIDVPVGWAAETETITLEPQVSATACLDVTPGTNVPVGVVQLGAEARSVGAPAVATRMTFWILLRDVPKAPDLREGLEELRIPWGAHDHMRLAVLDDGSLVVTSSETWTRRLDGLSLHDSDDVDRFHVVLPDPALPAAGGHAALSFLPATRCTSILREEPFTGEEQTIMLTSSLSATMRAPGRNAQDEELLVFTESGHLRRRATMARHEVVATVEEECADTAAPIGPARTVEIRPMFASRYHFPEYSMELAYEVTATRVPTDANWLVDAAEAGAASAGPLPCAGGGAFPFCAPGDLVLELDRPRFAKAQCEGGVCPDYVPFWWAGGAFELRADADRLGLAFDLLDVRGDVLGSAGGFPTREIEPPIGTDGPRAAPESPLPSNHASLSMPGLKPGFYVLAVSGPETPYTLELAVPPVPDADGDGFPDAFDGCPDEAETVNGFEDGDGCADDVTPPSVTCAGTPAVLWPPDGKFRHVTASVDVVDDGSGPAGFELESVTSSRGGDDDFSAWEIGTPDLEGGLRAERDGRETNGRVYTLTYVGRDVAGNEARCRVEITVPHDQRSDG